MILTLFIFSLYIVYLEFFHIDEPNELSKEEIIKIYEKDNRSNNFLVVERRYNNK